jgi:hypothetical protein
MVEGKTHIGGGASTFVITGEISLAGLVFKAPKWRKHVLQEASDVLPAHYCDNCGTLVTETPRKGLSTLES